jgi:(E)-4-hydroxy-3-methylbut-2-enyl-diphosphate synthase
LVMLCRMAVTINGTETEGQVRALESLNPICALLNIAAGTSRVHASRRVFHIIKSNSIETPVIHHRVFKGSPVQDEIAILTGSEIGGLLVDGLGDGVMLDVPSAAVQVLRTTSFGLLQVRPLHLHHRTTIEHVFTTITEAAKRDLMDEHSPVQVDLLLQCL